MALGLAVVHAQPFPSLLLDTARHIGRDQHISGCDVALAASRMGGAIVLGGLSAGAGNHGRASRLTRSMDVMDTIPEDIVGTNNFLSAPAVACSDSGYAVVWQGNGPSTYGVLRITLVSSTGEVVNRVPVDTEIENLYSLALAARSDRYALVLHDHRYSSPADEIRAAEVGLDGTILRRYVVVPEVPAHPPVREPDIVRGDSAYLVVWRGRDSITENYNICARFLWPDNPSADTAIFPVRKGANAFSPKVAFDGASFWVAWLEEAAHAETVAKVARVTQNGVVLDTGGIVVTGGAQSIVLAAARETTLVALQLQGNVIVSMRYDAAAQLLDSAPVLLSTHAVTGMAAAVAVDTFLVVWREEVEGVSEATERLAGRRITASGAVVDTDMRDYAFSASDHRMIYPVDAPIVASDGEDFLAVWCDRRAAPDFSARLLGRRFDNQGRFLDAEPIKITDPSPYGQRPVLTYGSGCYLVSWKSLGSYAVRVSRQGEVMDTVPIRLGGSDGFTVRGATFLRDSMFVLLGGQASPEVVRVMADGRVLDSVPRELKVRWGPWIANYEPSIASMGDTIVMACCILDGTYWLGVGLYDRSLKQYDSIWWPPAPNCIPPEYSSVACGGGRILVASDPGSRTAKPELWMLDSAGHLLNDSLSLENPCLYGNNFSIGYDGENFMCVKSGEGFTSLPGYRVSRDGDLLGWLQWAAFDSTLVTYHNGQASDTPGNVAIVFFTFEPNGYMTTRIRATVFPRLTGGVEETRGAPMPRHFCQTVVGHVLMLPQGIKARAYQLMDIGGRKVLDLHPGANDVRAFAPGVYFIREGLGVRGEGPGETRKIVLTE
jgi:hypothetical protein